MNMMRLIRYSEGKFIAITLLCLKLFKLVELMLCMTTFVFIFSRPDYRNRNWKHKSGCKDVCFAITCFIFLVGMFYGMVCLALLQNHRHSHNDSNSSTKILITTGFPFEHGQYHEIIDLASLESTCQTLNFQKLPKLWGATGAVIRGHPIICGGENSHFGEESMCYVLGNSKLNSFPMKVKRGDPFAVKINEVCRQCNVNKQLMLL